MPTAIERNSPQYSPHPRHSKTVYERMTQITHLATMAVMTVISKLNRFTQYLFQGGLGDISSNTVLMLGIIPKLLALVRSTEVEKFLCTLLVVLRSMATFFQSTQITNIKKEVVILANSSEANDVLHTSRESLEALMRIIRSEEVTAVKDQFELFITHLTNDILRLRGEIPGATEDRTQTWINICIYAQWLYRMEIIDVYEAQWLRKQARRQSSQLYIIYCAFGPANALFPNTNYVDDEGNESDNSSVASDKSNQSDRRGEDEDIELDDSQDQHSPNNLLRQRSYQKPNSILRLPEHISEIGSLEREAHDLFVQYVRELMFEENETVRG